MALPSFPFTTRVPSWFLHSTAPCLQADACAIDVVQRTGMVEHQASLMGKSFLCSRPAWSSYST